MTDQAETLNPAQAALDANNAAVEAMRAGDNEAAANWAAISANFLQMADPRTMRRALGNTGRGPA